jgi:hypothetical protein
MEKYNFSSEEPEKKLTSSLKNGWNTIIVLIFIGIFLGSSYEDFQDNELFFQSGLSCLDSKNLIISTQNSFVEKYKPIKVSGQILIDELNNFNDYKGNNQEYISFTSFEQLQIHNELIPNHKSVVFIEEFYRSVNDYNTFLNSKQSNFEISNLHHKSHTYALSVQNSTEAMKQYLNEFEKRVVEVLIYIDILEEYYFEWEIATTSKEKDAVVELYLERINKQVDKIDLLTGSVDSYNLEFENLEEIMDLEYEDMNLNKCNNEE